MIVVSDSSALLNLGIIHQLELLPQLYGNIVVPQAVYRELTIAGAGQPGADEVSAAAWIEVRQADDRALLQALSMVLDVGEAEAIALAAELKADLLLMDERKGRAAAARLNLRYIGLLGILIDAKRHGHIMLVKPVVDDLIATAGFWISRDLYATVMQAAGE